MRTFLEHGRADIVVAVSEPVLLFAGVEGNAVPAGMLAFEWNRSQADLVEGAERTPLPAGIYECELTWVLRATYPGPIRGLHPRDGPIAHTNLRDPNHHHLTR